jgi:hypothetical protein
MIFEGFALLIRELAQYVSFSSPELCRFVMVHFRLPQFSR